MASILLILASGDFAIVLGFAGISPRSMSGSLPQRIPKVNFSAAGVRRSVAQQKLAGCENETAPSAEGAGCGENRAEVVVPGLNAPETRHAAAAMLTDNSATALSAPLPPELLPITLKRCSPFGCAVSVRPASGESASTTTNAGDPGDCCKYV